MKSCRKSDRFDTLVAICIPAESMVSRRSRTRPSNAPVVESRTSMKSVASPAFAVNVRERPADIVSGALR